MVVMQHILLKLKTLEQLRWIKNMASQSLEPGVLVQTEQNQLHRDTYSKAIVNTDRAAYQRHKVERAQKQKMVTAVNEINSLKADMSELKDMVAALLVASRNN